MIALLLFGCIGGIPLTDEQKAHVQTLADAARAANEPLEAARKEALLAARGRIGPRPDLGGCPVVVPRPTDTDAGSFADEGVTFALSTAPISVVAAADLERADGPRWDRVQNAIVNDVEAMLIGAYRAEDYAEVEAKFEAAKRLTDPRWMPVDATFIADAYLPPVVGADSFTSGAVSGRLYVWDYATGAIVCAATARAENSDTLGVHLHLGEDNGIVGAKSDADRDLYRNVVRKALDTLSVAGPALFAVGP